MEVDAVITWVDGGDPGHIRKRQTYLGDACALPTESTLDKRWIGADEIRLCLASIQRYAPWFRHIWIITDDQVPDLTGLSPEASRKVRLISHREIFAGHLDLLPTFNSVSIETMMWRIPGLSERFVYFNDDFLLINPVAPRHFFREDRVVLRGHWQTLTESAATEFLALNMYRKHKVNAAKIYGYDARRFFSIAHVAIPMLRSVIAEAFEERPELFLRNAAYRFRDPTQFHLPSLFCNAAIRAGTAIFPSRRDWMNFSSRYSARAGRLQPALALLALKALGYRLFCVNDLTKLERRSPLLGRTLRLVAG